MSGSDFPLFQIHVKAAFPNMKDGLYLYRSFLYISVTTSWYWRSMSMYAVMFL